jgi:hypothetical protein
MSLLGNKEKGLQHAVVGMLDFHLKSLYPKGEGDIMGHFNKGVRIFFAN